MSKRIWPPLVELTRVRILEFVREPEAIFWAFVFPILITLALGVAFPASGDDPIVVGIEAGEGAAAVRAALERAGGFRMRDVTPDGVGAALRDGRVHVVVAAPPARVPGARFGEASPPSGVAGAGSAEAGDPPTYRFDPTRAESRLARLAVDEALKRAAGRVDPWQAREDRVQVAGARYVDWLIPGLLGMGIMTNGMWGVSLTIVQARLRKLLKRLVASPMRKRDFLLAHMLARLLGLAGEVSVLVAFGVLAFGMPMRGSLAAVAALALIGGLAFAGLGLLAASRVRTFEAISGILNMAMLPMWILSGVFFSSANFPDRVQPAIKALPLTALNESLRAVILEGASLVDVRAQIAILSAWGLGSFAIALRIFRWR